MIGTSPTDWKRILSRQSSCNLIRQDQAKKSKKSLNIIHIGNICKFYFILALSMRIKASNKLSCIAD